MKVILKDCRAAFLNIWEAKSFEPGAKPKFNGSFLFAPNSPNAKIMETAVKQVATEAWGPKADEVLAQIKGIPNKFCYRNGNSKPEYEGYPGNLFVGASNATRPKIMDRDGKTPLIQADGRPYSGCQTHAILDIWAQDNKYGKGIQASLLGIQFVADGDAFAGGGTASEEDFEDLSDGADAPAVGATGTGGGFV